MGDLAILEALHEKSLGGKAQAPSCCLLPVSTPCTSCTWLHAWHLFVCHTFSYWFRIVCFLKFTQRFRASRFMFAFNARDTRCVCAREPISQHARWSNRMQHGDMSASGNCAALRARDYSLGVSLPQSWNQSRRFPLCARAGIRDPGRETTESKWETGCQSGEVASEALNV